MFFLTKSPIYWGFYTEWHIMWCWQGSARNTHRNGETRGKIRFGKKGRKLGEVEGGSRRCTPMNTDKEAEVHRFKPQREILFTPLCGVTPRPPLLRRVGD